MALANRFKNAWNAFTNKEMDHSNENIFFYGDYSNPAYLGVRTTNVKTIVASVYNRICVDCSSIDIRHIKTDDNGSYLETIDGLLNRALTFSPNKDQTPRSIIQDAVSRMLNDGCVAIVPYELDMDPSDTDSFTVSKIRAGKIIKWFPNSVVVDLYNDLNGRHQLLEVEKRLCVILENPFYSIMNEPNSTAQRLKETLIRIDKTNESNSSGKFNMAIQLPYSMQSELKKRSAKRRSDEIERDLAESKYGIATIDATEKLIQLNRPIDNNLWEQAKDLTTELLTQLNLSVSILNGTASESEMLNYLNNIIKPIMEEIIQEMERKWLSQTAITRGQRIRYFINPFNLIPTSQFIELSESLSRNEIMTSNEIRGIIGLRPSADPKADELRNSNLNHPDETEDSLQIQNE